MSLVWSSFGLFVVGALAWRIVNRLFRSPLVGIPGPWLAKVTGLYEKYYLVQANMHIKLKELHEEYGSIVQFGPNRVSINTKEGVDIIYKSNSFEKSQIYQAFGFGGANTFTVNYNSRKRVIKKIFTVKNLKTLEPMIQDQALAPFVEKLKSSETCSIYELFHFMTFDIIGSVLFSCNFNLVSNGKHPIVHWLRDAQFYSIVKFLIPPIKHFKGCFGQGGFNDVINFCQALIDNRKKEEPKDDTLQAFLDAIDDSTGLPFSNEDIRAELIILVMGAIDTTSNTLFWALKLLLETPLELEKLVAEIDAAFPLPDAITLDVIKEKCPYLIAVLNETMRLYPAAAGQTPRFVPGGGAEFEGHFLPAGTECGVSIYAYHRSSQIWSDPDTFRPERFFGPSGAEAKENLIPFLTGPRACIGREMAKMIMYLTLATLLRRFKVDWHDPNPTITPIYHIVLKAIESDILINVTSRTT